MKATYQYTRVLPDGTVKVVGPFAVPREAQRMIAHALVDNGYAPKGEASEFAAAVLVVGPPRTHEGSGVTYSIQTILRDDDGTVIVVDEMSDLTRPSLGAREAVARALLAGREEV